MFSLSILYNGLNAKYAVLQKVITTRHPAQSLSGSCKLEMQHFRVSSAELHSMLCTLLWRGKGYYEITSTA